MRYVGAYEKLSGWMAVTIAESVLGSTHPISVATLTFSNPRLNFIGLSGGICG